MENADTNNQVKWLLIDQMVDLTAAVCMGREVLNAFRDERFTLKQAMCRLRVCNHSLILSLYKVWEVRKHYNQYLRTLDREYIDPIFEYAKEIDRRNINKFRGRYAAHIWDLNKKPISLVEAQVLLDTITGDQNEKVEEFYNWIWLDESPCIVTAIDRAVGYLRTLPGGDFPRF